MSVQDLLPGLEASQNVHPMFVHLPLGLWPVAFAFFVVGAARHSERLVEVGRWMLYLATVAAVSPAVLPSVRLPPLSLGCGRGPSHHNRCKRCSWRCGRRGLG